MRQTEGFTIIEVLLAVSLLSIIIVLVMTSLTGSFKLWGNINLQATSSNRAEAVIEAIRGQWQQVPSQYQSACVIYTLPAGVSVSIQDETATGASYNAPYAPTFAASCDTATPLSTVAPLRQITVTSTTTSGASTGRSQLVVELASP